MVKPQGVEEAANARVSRGREQNVSKTVNTTHRRPMRAVTPMTRAARTAGGAAMAAGIMLTGGSFAAADETGIKGAPQAEGASPAALAPVTAPSVAIPGTKAGASAFTLAPAASTITVKAPVEQADEAEVTERRSEERATRSNEREDRRDRNDRDERREEKKESRNEGRELSPGKGASILATARSGIGVPYVWGGSTPQGWDCSGFTAWVYAQHGISLPHSAGAQARMGKRIPRSEARPGDLVYKPGHVGIYAGNGRLVDAGNRRVDTSERALYSGNWSFYRIVG